MIASVVLMSLGAISALMLRDVDAAPTMRRPGQPAPAAAMEH